MSKDSRNIAIVGSGPSALGFISGLVNKLREYPLVMAMKDIFDEKAQYKEDLQNWHIDIFDRSTNPGSGLPYDHTISGPEHLINVQIISNANIGYKDSDRDNFYKWLQKPTNQQKINQKFQEIFHEKLKQKFNIFFAPQEYDEALFAGKTIFDQDFNETAGYKIYQNIRGKNDAKFSELVSHYQNKWQDIQARYLKFSEHMTFLPRIAYGIYQQVKFEEALNELRELVGDNNVVVHKATNVVGIETGGELLYEQNGQVHSQKFSDIILATGRWQRDESEISKDDPKNYIRNAWPIKDVEKRIWQIIAEAQKAGKTEVRIAIEGSSLSAVDMAKTCAMGLFQELEDKESPSGKKLIFIPEITSQNISQNDSENKTGNNVKNGVKIIVDMVSRNGVLNTVKGNLTWRQNQKGIYFNDALAEVAKARAIKIDPANIVGKTIMAEIITQEINKNPDGKITLSQVLTIFLQILEAAYRKAGQDGNAVKIQAAEQIAPAIVKINKSAEDFLEVVEEFAAARSADAFQTLRSDLEGQKGDNEQGDYILERICGYFIDVVKYKEFLPDADKKLLDKFRSVINAYAAPMPPESARDLLCLNEAGILNVVQLGHQYQSVNKDGNKAYQLENGQVLEYDLVINSKGPRLNAHKLKAAAESKEKPSDPLYTSLAHNFNIKSDPLGEIVTQTFNSKKANETQDSNITRITALRDLASISGAWQAGKKAAEILVEQSYGFLRPDSSFSPQTKMNIGEDNKACSRQ